MFKRKTRAVNIQIFLAICGIAGPIIYLIVLVALGSLELNYSPIRQTMSELGSVDAKYNVIMNTIGFALFGLLLMAFAIGLDRGIGTGTFSRLGPALLVSLGLFIIMIGIFPCDPESFKLTNIGKLHSFFVVMAVISMTFALVAISSRMWRDDRWRNYVAYTMWTALAMLIIAVLYRFGVFESWKGALERVLMAVPLLWIEVIAIRLLCLSWYNRPSSNNLD